MKDNEKDKKKNNPWESDENNYSELIIETQDLNHISQKQEDLNISTKKDDIWSELDFTENSQKEEKKEELILEIDEEPVTRTEDVSDNIIFEETDSQNQIIEDESSEEKVVSQKKSKTIKEDPWQAEEKKEELILEIDEEPVTRTEDVSDNIIFEETDSQNQIIEDESSEEKVVSQKKSKTIKEDPWQAEEKKEELILEIDEEPITQETEDVDVSENIIFEETDSQNQIIEDESSEEKVVSQKKSKDYQRRPMAG